MALNFKLGSIALAFLASAAISQEAIRFVIPTDSSGAPLPVALPQKPDTVQKLGAASNRPLNLAELTVKDTASFETYSQRLALVQDSISATHRAIESVKKNSVSFMPKLEPKGEFEKQPEYEARSDKWHKELAERTERDTRSFSQRLAELEKAKKKIEENQVSLYSSVSIKSSPEAASIWIGREEIGATPADYNLLIPGTVKIIIRKEGYNPWDTTFTAAPGTKYKISAAMEEKSIFSTENEIDFGRILKRDTTIQGYESRIKAVRTRWAQVGNEIKQIIENFASSYPPLEPQKPEESLDAFNNRRELWVKEGTRQVAELQKKHDDYRKKLERSAAVLRDYIVVTQSAIMSEPSFNAKIELGAYDADREQFELLAQDTASQKSPFLFKGRVGVPRDTAKTMNRAAPGFVASLQYINFPFETESGSVNLAMSKFLLSKSGLDLKTEGSFSEIERYKLEVGYSKWKLRADSLLGGSLKSDGLDYAYAMGKPSVGPLADGGKEDSGGGLGWRGWTRIITFTAAAALGGVAVYKHLEVNKKVKEVNDLARKVPPTNDPADPDMIKWAKEYGKNSKAVEDNELQRNIFGIAAGAFAVGGVVTFFF